MAKKHARDVYLWANGNVMVLDTDGNQMPEYQGPYEEVAGRIRSDFPRAKWHGTAGEPLQWLTSSALPQSPPTRP